MSTVSAYVTEIERGSYEDGPGLRTVVFFKGCPLSCAWCHNPECIDPAPQVLRYPEKCIGCGMCEQGCFSGASVVCGQEMTDEEIFSYILADREYYGKDGGVTFSGGEPLMHREMLRRLLERCRQESIHTAVETSLFLFDEEILSAVDFVMADLKMMDAQKHRRYTGVDNKAILAHFQALDRLGTPFMVRTPIIPGVNNTPQEITTTRTFIEKFENLTAYELLPYHPLGLPKRRALGMEAVEFSIPTEQEMEALRTYADISRTIGRHSPKKD